MVPKGYIARLYVNDYYYDYFASVVGSYLDDETQELECFSSFGDHDDALSSLKILKLGTAIGYW